MEATAERDGIKLRYANLSSCPKSPKSIIKSYTKLVTKKTKAIFVTDLINYSGCQVPTKEIMSAMPSQVRYRIVDTAQSFANSRNDFPALGGTHIGTSLHKWLGAPAASGLLYVQKDFIQETWPLFASKDGREIGIKKFSHIGTLNPAVFPASLLAIQFHQLIGAENKCRRLIALADYFVEQLDGVENVTVNSPRHEYLKSNIVLIRVKNISAAKVGKYLWAKHQIHTTTSNWNAIKGVRISMNVFTNKDDIDRLVQILSNLSF